MTRENLDEEHAIADVMARLGERFPAATHEQISTAVGEARAGFEGAKVRDFVPVLIERDARARLEKAV